MNQNYYLKKIKLSNKFIFIFFSIMIAYLIVSSNIYSTVKSKNMSKINSSKNKYAIIVVGRFIGSIYDIFPDRTQQYYDWYSNAVQLLYTSPKDEYHYTDEHIFLLFSLREHFVLHAGFYEYWIDFNSSKENLASLLDSFNIREENELHENDTLLFCFIYHGNDDSRIDGVNASNTFFGFPYDFKNIWEIFQFYILKVHQEKYKLYDWELGKMCNNVTNGFLIFLLQPCNSGGFINDLSRENRIICTSSRENETANEAWIEPFARGLSGLADSSHDGYVSIQEAYEYAFMTVTERTKSKHPLLDDNGDGVGHYMNESGYQPMNESYDGYLSSITYL